MSLLHSCGFIKATAMMVNNKKGPKIYCRIYTALKKNMCTVSRDMDYNRGRSPGFTEDLALEAMGIIRAKGMHVANCALI